MVCRTDTGSVPMMAHQGLYSNAVHVTTVCEKHRPSTAYSSQFFRLACFITMWAAAEARDRDSQEISTSERKWHTFERTVIRPRMCQTRHAKAWDGIAMAA